MQLRYSLCLLLLHVLWFTDAGSAQDQKNADPKSPKEEFTVIRGEIALPARFADQFDLSELQIELLEEVQLNEPPLPSDWAQRPIEEQDKWWDAFIETDDGKQFLEERERIIESAKVIPIRLEEAGKFVVYDVPAGVYAIRGRQDKTLNGIDVAFEVFGRLEVAKGTDEVIMQKLEVVVTPLLKTADSAPAVQLPKISGETFDLSSLKGKYVMLYFWSMQSPPSVEFSKTLAEIVAELQSNRELELVTISLDEDRAPVEEHIRSAGLPGIHLSSPGWNSATFEHYGVRGIPSLWLIDREQKVLMSNREITVAMRVSQWELKRILEAAIGGQPIDNYPPKPVEQTPVGD